MREEEMSEGGGVMREGVMRKKGSDKCIMMR
jgi:hypothetical protein